ncbi:zinc finger protein 502-like [Biomphalaria glabrata]|uniref:Zinc finger protein 502-like n=1 Tax=Biomphalaria glabrata TaxID=6526 RepID=A0A9W2YLM6_BIOGL|nr:zinc finger protein 502-like [Biomphalaria glabrata]XP_055863609.1 zinc finger protein 502-like [Biomphalaria glabrata]XP_055863610.1 zinc finger protein 502-like [Biomphalaria glabrata]XP_055863611.1 zinc finger protein 502-like [Biomphalaria glabrata]XP_055863612.1 zinc finger protein 502-like [Biomphalaria glabrata]XP_055863613.1 zinc finger protein 502-like [Biomphalaria glabrata]XP_055863614.1 zinc finger protein 502-like [Biomphalaria glabrata]XP_055863615.1 zinc finger protein 502-
MEFDLPFPKLSTDSSDSFLRYKLLKQRFLCHFKQKNQEDYRYLAKESSEISLLLFLGGEKVYRLAKSYLSLVNQGDENLKNSVNKLLFDLENLCLPLFILLYERFKFFTYHQSERDNIIKFILLLNSFASYCELCDNANEQFLSQLQNGVFNDDLRSQLHQQKPKSLKEMLTICLKFDALKQSNLDESAKKKMKLEDTVKLISEMCKFNTLDLCSEHNENVKSTLKSNMEQERNKVSKSDNKIPLSSPSNYNEVTTGQTRIKFNLFKADKSLSETNVQKKTARISSESFVVKKRKRDKKSLEMIVNNDHSSQNFGITHSLATEATSLTRNITKKQETNDSKFSFISVEEVLTDIADDKYNQKDENLKLKSSEEKGIEINNSICIKKDDIYMCTELLKHQEKKKCSVSNMTFQSSPNLNIHKHSHHDQQQFKCDICQIVFIHWDSHSIHMQSTHPELLTLKCEQCDLWFDVQTSLDFHKKTHTKSITCTECGQFFTKTREYHQHRQKEHPNFCFPCDKCELTFLFPSKLKIHQMSKHNASKPYICEVCGSSFAEYNMLVSHKNYHFGNRKFQCVMCGRRFVLRSTMKSHMPTHLEEKPHICIICGMGFKVQNYLKTHIKIHSNNRIKTHVCSKCGAAYFKASHLKNHERKHTGEKPYKCDTCGVAFFQMSNLKNHAKYVHEGYRPKDKFSCEYCGLSFSFSSKLKLHLMKHTGEKPYSCSNCNSAYREKSQLVYHMKSHNGQKDYQCPICNQLFLQKAYLEGHMRKHTGEKPFACLICSVSFTHKSYLRDHEKVHNLNRERKHKCRVCGKAFTCSSHLRSHERLHSGDKPHSCPICGDQFTKRFSVKKHLRRIHGIQNILDDIKFSQLSHDRASLTQLHHHDDTTSPIIPQDIHTPHSDPHQKIHFTSCTQATPSDPVLNRVFSDDIGTELQPQLQQPNTLHPAAISQMQQHNIARPGLLPAQMSVQS